ncbi:TetR/AcrR family transcriptional regulator [Pararhizobium sp. PWRC1-1]|uniref:TetR/AcrR family transcriptional regulator n=1 Tax=Pararhizobium sp. PWRC1-1 TaxID=2804566 RepID=UPI003CF380EB
MSDRTSLTPLDWTVAGITALAEGGIDAVRVERLAKRLGTSKGSFYWHFANRPALLAAMLELWERESTADVIEHVAAITDPAERLRHVTREALEAKTRGVDVAHAVRSWAAQDPAVAVRFVRVEQARTAFLAHELAALGYDSPTALRLGKALYLALIGLYDARRYATELADDAALLDLLERVIAAVPVRSGWPP